MNIQMRIITDENVDQLMSMSYSNNISKLLHKPEDSSKEQTEKIIKDFVANINMNVRSTMKRQVDETPEMPTPVGEVDIKMQIQKPGESPQYNPRDSSEDYGFYETGYTPPGKLDNQTQQSPPWTPGSSPAYAPGYSPPYAPGSPPYAPDSSPPYAPGSSPQYAPGSPQYYSTPSPYDPNSPVYRPGESSSVPPPEQSLPVATPSILEVPNETVEKKESESDSSTTTTTSSEEPKKVIEMQPESSSDVSTSSGVKKITI
jgi:hypothetical protein